MQEPKFCGIIPLSDERKKLFVFVLNAQVPVIKFHVLRGKFGRGCIFFLYLDRDSFGESRAQAETENGPSSILVLLIKRK